MSLFSVGVLLYGDYPELAGRCLRSLLPASIAEAEQGAPLADFRLGLNRVSLATRELALDWAQQAKGQWAVDVIVYEPEWPEGAAALKYPVMRRMLYDRDCPPAARWMWFDDDSYRTAEKEAPWWRQCGELLDRHPLAGAVHTMDWLPGQQEWLRQRFRCVCSPLTAPQIRFVTGGWWLARTRNLRALDWPWPELRHRGGDSLLGAAAVCHGWSLGNVRRSQRGVAINANRGGVESESAGRACTRTEPRFAAGYPSNPWDDTSHQDFRCRKWIV